MTKNIIIGILVLLTLVFFLSAYFQKVEADKVRLQAEENLVLAIEARKQADINAEAARQAEMKAAAQQKLAEEALRNCKGRK